MRSSHASSFRFKSTTHTRRPGASVWIALSLLTLASICTKGVNGEFSEDDLDDSYSLRAGDETSCPRKIEFDGGFAESIVKAGEVEINEESCTGGTLVLTKNPTTSAATQYLYNLRNDIGSFLAGTVNGEITCGLAKLNDNEEIIFFSPDEDGIDISWAKVFGTSDAPLARAEEDRELDEDAKYVILGNRCFYEETRLVDRVCFPPSAMARLADGTARRMDQLAIGDRLAQLSTATSSSLQSPLVAWSHADPRSSARFIRAATASHGALVASEGHFIYADGKLRPMNHLRVGMRLSHESGIDVSITNISSFISRGLYNPHTLSGDIIVDGFRVSCYTTVIRPMAAHALLAPIRAAFRSLVSLISSASPFYAY